jgi:hypothetical protein
MKFTDYKEANRISDILATTFHNVLERKDDSYLHINNYLFLKDGPYDEDDDNDDFHLPDEIIKEVNTFLFDAGMFFIPLKDTSIVIKREKLLLHNSTLKDLIRRNDAQKKARKKDQAVNRHAIMTHL